MKSIQISKILVLTISLGSILLMVPTPLTACSLTSAGTCGGPCDIGMICDKNSDSKCDCVLPVPEPVECSPGERSCELEGGEVICWPAEEDCPSPLSSAEPESSALQVVFSQHEASEKGRGSQEITVSVSGCQRCFNGERLVLPGRVVGIAPLDAYFQGSVRYSGLHWQGDTVWEHACFGNTNDRCGSVRRTYLINYQ